MKLLDSAAQVFMNKQHRSEISRHSKVTELPLWLNVLFNGWGMYIRFKGQGHFSWENRVTERWQGFYLKWTCTYIYFFIFVCDCFYSSQLLNFLPFSRRTELTKHYHLPSLTIWGPEGFIPIRVLRDSSISSVLWTPIRSAIFFWMQYFFANINLSVGPFFICGGMVGKCW